MQFGLILQWREARTLYFYQKCISMKVIYLNKNRDKMTSMSPRRQIWTTQVNNVKKHTPHLTERTKAKVTTSK